MNLLGRTVGAELIHLIYTIYEVTVFINELWNGELHDEAPTKRNMRYTSICRGESRPRRRRRRSVYAAFSIMNMLRS